MNVSIKECAAIPHEQPESVWRQLLAQQTHYPFFHTPDWLHFLEGLLSGAVSHTLWLRFSDGLQAVLPALSLPKKWGLRKLESLPWATYGGLIADAPYTSEHLQKAASLRLSLRQPIAEITLPPHWPFNPAHSTQQRPRETHLLYLNEDWDAITARFQPRIRTAIRKAERVGVRVWKSNAETLPHASAIFQSLYHAAQDHWAAAETLPIPFFDNLPQLPSDCASIFIAEHDETALAAGLLFYGKDEAQYFAGASRRQQASLQAPKLLMREMIHDSYQQECVLFNFGSSRGIAGVEQFKQRFGGQTQTYWQFRITHPLFHYRLAL